MTVTCPSCHTSLSIPDERLPKGKVLTAACPRCKGQIVIDTSPPPAGPRPEAAGGASAATLPAPRPESPAAYA
ncbi:MAG: zinc-ribbon domain-containing protein, partial [candidate division NC10 bacterium]|nr:zinc-ribbon domain-containing protein [candidate division NC10 bacterium]